MLRLPSRAGASRGAVACRYTMSEWPVSGKDREY